jgi:hypothetical protein
MKALQKEIELINAWAFMIGQTQCIVYYSDCSFSIYYDAVTSDNKGIVHFWY